MARPRLSLNRRHRRIALRVGFGALGVVTVVGLVILLLGPASTWAGGSTVRQLIGKERADAINAVRQTLLQAAAGVAALSVLAFTGMTFLLNRRGQVTDRYAKAVEMLASDKRAERIGGIYALEHVMIESELDHDTVVQVLAAFIRENAPARTTTTTRPSEGVRRHHNSTGAPDTDQPDEPGEPAADIQAALTVLGRRPQRDEIRRPDLRRTELRGADLYEAHLGAIDFSWANLERANLMRANLEEAYLRGAHLEGAALQGVHLERALLPGAHLKEVDFSSAHLEGAVLLGAHLEGSMFPGTHLEGANLIMAHLEGSILVGAHLEGADMNMAHLEGAVLKEVNLERANLAEAHLEGADLSGATGLTQSQIGLAVMNTETKLPSHLTPDDREHPGS